MIDEEKNGRIPEKPGHAKRKRLVFFAALAIALAAHSLFFALFSAMDSKNTSASKPGKEKAFFGDTQTSPVFAKLLDYADPEAISKPDASKGFSSILGKKRSPDKAGDPKTAWRNPKFRLYFMEKKTETLFDFDDNDSSSRLLKYWKPLLDGTGGPGLQAAILPSPAFPLCTSEDGIVLPVDLKSFGMESLSEKEIPKSLSVFRLDFMEGGLPRARILSSCGDDGLDRRALGAVLGAFGRIRSEMQLKSEGLTVLVHWKKGLATCSN